MFWLFAVWLLLIHACSLWNKRDIFGEVRLGVQWLRVWQAVHSYWACVSWLISVVLVECASILCSFVHFLCMMCV